MHVHFLLTFIFASVVFGHQVIPGCPKCLGFWCPKEASLCPLGLMEDPCGCCPNGVCTRLEGEECYNKSLVPPPPIETKKYGSCGRNLNCLYRDDNDVVDSDFDIPHAICVCDDTRMVCASNNQTYSSICEINQVAIEKELSSDIFFLKNYGPCVSAPIITSPPVDVTSDLDQIVVLSCEVRGYPIPTITWEFESKDRTVKKHLPADAPHIAVQSRGGPDYFMTTSWVQIVTLHMTDVGVYTCIAKNEEGVTEATAEVHLHEVRDEV